MATSLLLRSLISRRVLHSTTSAISTFRCLTDNVKKRRSTTSPVGKILISLASRPFSSKPAGDVERTELEEDSFKAQLPFIDPLKVILDPEKSKWVSKIVEAPGGDAWIEQRDGDGVLRYSFSQFGPFSFTTMKKLRELEYRTTLSKAVMFVSSYYNDDLRDAAKEAATIAGFDVLKIFTDESSAAERSYDIIKGKQCRHLAVLDLRHGSFYIHIEEIIHVGGASEILETIVREIKRIHGKDIRNYPSKYEEIEEFQKIMEKAAKMEKAEKACGDVSYDLDIFPKTNIVKLATSIGGEFISLTLEVSK